MIYKQFRGKRLSMLGFGCMRLPVKNGVYADINEQAAAEMIELAMRNGVNYYDTAWGYHDGNSETVMGRILSKYPRESFYLASKFPGYDLTNLDKVEEIFEKQLKKCGVEYFDFYLFHNVCELNIDGYLDEKHGIFDYLMAQKRNGRIKHLGFSAHGDMDVLTRFLDKYGEYMEFGQLQINYLDWEFQNAKQKAELLSSRGIPVWVMEPLRGGRLAKLDPEHETELKKLRPKEGIPAWAFRFLQSLPQVSVILSGMSDLAQVTDNLNTFKDDKPLTDVEMRALLHIADEMTGKTKLPCTACKYCTSHCPKRLDIPELIKLYNEHRFTGGGFIAPMALSAYAEEKKPSACIGCKSCEKVCPQGIKISEMMTDFTARLKEN
ncbi:MAG: 4Fe-4S dicluster domain-containing protein [Clostridia bacterium]|jgi:predicted aldo/keto reductase-like oxidoreductase|nr:4Fe-4S dicluster domain-containing protein [Clostridia bacterium]